MYKRTDFVEVISALDEDRLQTDINNLISKKKAEGYECVGVTIGVAFHPKMNEICGTAIVSFHTL